MSHALAARNAARKESARIIMDLILDHVTTAGNATIPQLVTALGITNYTVQRWTRVMLEDGRLTAIKTGAGINGKQIRVFSATNRAAIDPRHDAVIAKARRLPQPFASLVAQFI